MCDGGEGRKEGDSFFLQYVSVVKVRKYAKFTLNFRYLLRTAVEGRHSMSLSLQNIGSRITLRTDITCKFTVHTLIVLNLGPSENSVEIRRKKKTRRQGR